MSRIIAANAAIERIARWAAARRLDLRADRCTGSGAVFSRCGRWRYLLWRIDRADEPLMGAGLLNPSTADELRDDPTIRRCRERARSAQAGLLVWNLFAWRATLPAELKRASDPIGPDNDSAIGVAISVSASTLAGWGNHGQYLGRDLAVLATCRAGRVDLLALGRTRTGAPRHPLYVAGAVPMQRFTEEADSPLQDRQD